ncbi:hypothetical protein GASC598I20_015740 [Gilliamella apicola SCGC AB-598-I20]|nr:hypothetical protein GASC598I20_015740 [Gilliamella apicola SCGC AB-598-I20]
MFNDLSLINRGCIIIGKPNNTTIFNQYIAEFVK